MPAFGDQSGSLTMQEPHNKTIHAFSSVLLLVLITFSSAIAQVVIKDSVEIGPKQAIHPQSTFSSPPSVVEFKITWQQNSNGVPARIHLLVLDPANNLWGFDPYSQDILTDMNSSYVENTKDTITTLIMLAPPAGKYFFFTMVDTLEDSFIDAALPIRIIVDGNSFGEATYAGGAFAYIPDTPFRVGDATWDLIVQCASTSFTLAVPQLDFVYQPSPYPLDVVSYVQDNCGDMVSPGDGYFIRAEILDGLQWGDLHDPATGRYGAVIDSIPIIAGQGAFDYRPWGDEVSQTQIVRLKISSTLPGSTPVTQTFQVRPGDPPLKMLSNRDTISYGDTTALKFIMEKSDGTPSTGQLVSSRFTIVEGDSAAFLYSPDSSVVGTDIYGLDSVHLYVPPMTNASISSKIKIVVSADEPCLDCGATIAVHGNKTLRPQVLKSSASKNAGKSPLSLRELLYKKSLQVFWKKVAASPNLAVALSKDRKASISGITQYDGFVTTHSGMGTVTVMSQNVNHFLVNVVPDTLSNRKTAPLTVIAIDNNGNEVPFDTSTSIDLSFDQGQDFVDFISPSNDTVTTLPRVSYGTLRSGRIKVIARGNSSTPVFAVAKSLSHKIGANSSVTSQGYQDQYPQAIVRVVVSADATKFATGTIFVRPEIKVIVVADSIQPFYLNHTSSNESQTSVKVAVTVSGLLYSGPPYGVILTSAAVEGSGGHYHTGNRPSGIFITGGGPASSQEFATGPDTIRATYQASVFGGHEHIIAALNLPMIADSDSVVVRVPFLKFLNEEANYIKTGGLCEHHGPRIDNSYPNCRTPDDDHYGTARLTQILQSVGDSLAVYCPGYRLLVNDMSLPNGGKFDIDGSWDENTDHKEHRLGVNADVGIYYNGQAVSLSSDTARTNILKALIVKSAGAEPGDEVEDKNHFHIQY